MACKRYWFSAKQAQMRAVLGGARTQVKVGNTWAEYTQCTQSKEIPAVWDDFVLVAEGDNCETSDGAVA